MEEVPEHAAARGRGGGGGGNDTTFLGVRAEGNVSSSRGRINVPTSTSGEDCGTLPPSGVLVSHLRNMEL